MQNMNSALGVFTNKQRLLKAVRVTGAPVFMLRNYFTSQHGVARYKFRNKFKKFNQ